LRFWAAALISNAPKRLEIDHDNL